MFLPRSATGSSTTIWGLTVARAFKSDRRTNERFVAEQEHGADRSQRFSVLRSRGLVVAGSGSGGSCSALSRRQRERWLAQLSNQDMQHDIRNPRIIITIRILLTITALMTLSGSLMGIYGTITQLQAWQDDPVSVIVAVLLSVLLLVGGGCLLRRSIKYDGHPA